MSNFWNFKNLKNKNKKLWITASFICIISGIIILTIGRLIGGRPGFYINRAGIHSANETTDTNSISAIQDEKDLEPFDRMDIHVDYADVEVILSDRYAIDYCVAGEYGEPICKVNNGKLIFKEANSSKFTFSNIGVGFFTSNFGIAASGPKYYLRIEIPTERELSEASFTIESGALDIPSLQADSLKITDEYGDVHLGKYKGKKLDIYLDSGALSVESMDAAQADIENEYGEINISEAKGNRMTLDIDSCDCQLGAIDFSDVKIKSEYGDISLGLSEVIDDYGLDLYTEYGDIRVENERLGFSSDDEMTYRTTGKGKKKIMVSCESGNIEVYSVK